MIRFVDWGPIIMDPGWQKSINNSLRHSFKIAARQMEALAKVYVPVKTGELQGSITGRVRQPAGKIYIELLATAEHAEWVEYGTGKRGKGSYLGGGAASPADMETLGLPSFYNHGAVSGVYAQPYLRPALINVMKLMGEWKD